MLTRDIAGPAPISAHAGPDAGAAAQSGWLRQPARRREKPDPRDRFERLNRGIYIFNVQRSITQCCGRLRVAM
jgi:hypothetical protein